MIDWNEIREIILGDMTITRFVAYFLVMSAGALVFFALDVKHSTSRNTDTPSKFNFKFMLRDNILRGLAVMIIMAAAVILFEDLFGVDINVKLAFTQGLGIDALIGTMLKIGKERGPMKKTREKLNKKYK